MEEEERKHLPSKIQNKVNRTRTLEISQRRKTIGSERQQLYKLTKMIVKGQRLMNSQRSTVQIQSKLQNL